MKRADPKVGWNRNGRAESSGVVMWQRRSARVEQGADFGVAYVYDGSLEGLLCAVLLAYERREVPDDIAPVDSFAPRLGQRVVEVETDMARAARVRDGLMRECGRDAFDAVCAVSLSDEVDKGSAALAFIRYAMKRGPRALYDHAHPSVERFDRIRRSVMNERHLWQQFMRFSRVEGGVYVARCNPKANVVPLLMDWFAARFNTQAFLVYDEVHRIAGVSSGGEWSLVKSDELHVPTAEPDDAFYERAWKSFYDTVAIEARYNPELRRSFMPKRMWKNVVEMRDIALAADGREARRDLGSALGGSVRLRPCGASDSAAAIDGDRGHVPNAAAGGGADSGGGRSCAPHGRGAGNATSGSGCSFPRHPPKSCA